VVLVINLAAQVTATAIQPEDSIIRNAGTSSGKTHHKQKSLISLPSAILALPKGLAFAASESAWHFSVMSDVTVASIIQFPFLHQQDYNSEHIA
jgi:hypothetical protein